MECDMTESKMERVKIQNGDWEAEILPGYSMNVISLKCEGEQVLRTAPDDETFAAGHIVYGIAFLLPPDRTVGGKFTFEDVEYSFPINEPKWNNNLHGLMTDADFEIVERGSDFVKGRYINSGERYPFGFICDITVRLDGNGMKETFEFRNNGSGSMPVLFGLHSNFLSRGYVQVPVEKEYIFDRSTFTPGDRAVELTEKGKLVLQGTDPNGKALSNFFASSGNTAIIDKYRYTVSDTFRNWVVWNGGGESGFVSVEPESGPANGLNMDGGYQIVKPDESIVYEIEISR